MRINEKNVISYSLCNSPIDKKGWLLKKGEVNKGFQKRWFVLKGNMLFYFEKQKTENEKEPIGVIILEGCTVELEEKEYDDYYTFAIRFPGPGCRSYILATDSQENMEDWMKAVTCAGYEFMKLMVVELQRQLDELNQNMTLSGLKAPPVGKRITDTDTIKMSQPVPEPPSPEPKRQSPPKKERSPMRAGPTPRFNPFNVLASPEEDELDGSPSPLVINSPIPLAVGVQVANSNFFDASMTLPIIQMPVSLSFEDMHEIYRRQIQERVSSGARDDNNT